MKILKDTRRFSHINLVSLADLDWGTKKEDFKARINQGCATVMAFSK
jgi:hypothetical protein